MGRGQILLVASSDPKTGTTGQNMVPSMAVTTQSQGRAQEVSAQVQWHSKPVSGSWGSGPSLLVQILSPLGPLTLYKLLRPLASSAIRAVEVPMLGKGPGCNHLSGLGLPRPLFPKFDSELYPQKYPKVVWPKTSRPLEYNIYNMRVLHAPPSAPQGILRDHPSLPDP